MFQVLHSEWDGPYWIHIDCYVCLFLLLSELPYSLNHTPLSISHSSWIVAAPPDVLNEIVIAVEY